MQINTTQLAPSIFGGTGSATTVARSDHLHDDRYYTKAQVDSRLPTVGSIALPGGGFTARDSFPIFSAGSACFANNLPGSGLRHTIPVPAGTTLTGLTVRTLATAAPMSQSVVTVFRQSPGSSDGTTVASATFVAAVGLDTRNVAVGPELVDPGEAVYVAFTTSSPLVFLCAVDVQFTRP